jgi:tyrosine-specific transport protein
MWRWILTTAFLLSFIMATSVITILFAVSLAGFWPSIIAIFFSWIYLLYTGLYYLEAILANPPGGNVFSISLRYLGIGGSWFSSCIFAIVNYSYLLFFLYLTGPIVSEMLSRIGITLSYAAVITCLTVILGVSVALGLTVTLIFNFLLTVLTAVIVYLCFTTSVPFTTSAHITTLQWGFLFIVFPTMVNSLYYNTLLPSIAPFLKNNRKLLKSSIIVALTLAALLFFAWLWLVIASVGSGLEELGKLNPETINFSSLSQVPVIGKWLPFILCLNVTSTFLSIGIILVDFFFDFLNTPPEKRRGWMRLAMCALVFIPPLLLSIAPNKFLYVTSIYTTEVGALYLVGLLPVMWIWSLRYFYQDQVHPLLPGGKPLVFIFAILSCFVFYLVGLEIFYERTFG